METSANKRSIPNFIQRFISFFLLQRSNSLIDLLPLIIIFTFALKSSEICSQGCYHPFIDSVISKVSIDSLSMFENELTGEVTAVIGGEYNRIISRYWESSFNQLAAQYIYERFKFYGLNTELWNYSSTGTNVIAVKTGLRYPNQKIILCAHYDNFIYGTVPDTTYGADDNASGTSAVLEAARILRNYEFDYTIIFAAWDEEEAGFFGSGAYADVCFKNGDSIVAVINMDMIGWDGNNDGKSRIGKDSNSVYLARIMESATNTYVPALNPQIALSGGSDDVAFQRRGYKAIQLIEDSGPDFNPYYHSIGERFFHFNLPYFVNMTRSAIAGLLVLQKDFVINIDHNPLQSTTDTSSRIVSAVITSNHRIVGSPDLDSKKAPRLYYRKWEGAFEQVSAFYESGDTFRFLIPAMPPGTVVSYYFAAQDSMSTLIASQPGGARGIDPPGTIAPENLYTYYILDGRTQCSITIPKVLPVRLISFDSIFIPETGEVLDVNVSLSINHPSDSSIAIWLAHSNFPMNQLSMFNGGSGDNYVNTTFDDEAEIPITEGFPPYTGSFKPEMALSSFDNAPLEGLWKLRIYNYSQTEPGELVNWCLTFQYFDPIGITNNQVPVKSSLSQNYPNPFNSSTSINYSLVRKSHVKITVYDVLGREVRSLINGDYLAGNYVLSFNAGEIASGLYFYSMLVDGNQFETKKMVLIK